MIAHAHRHIIIVIQYYDDLGHAVRVVAHLDGRRMLRLRPRRTTGVSIIVCTNLMTMTLSLNK